MSGEPTFDPKKLPTFDAEIRKHLEHWYELLSKGGSEVSQLSLGSRISTISNLDLSRAIGRTAVEIGSAQERMANVGTNLQNAIQVSTDKLIAAVDESSRASEKHAAALVKWTKWLVVATAILGFLTAVLAIDAAMKWF